MSNQDRDRMIQSLKQHVVPVLRNKGFKGSFPHVRRFGKDRIDLLMFQFDKWGGGFVVEISQCGSEGIPWGDTVVPPNKTTVPYTKAMSRYRLGAKDKNRDYWFRYESTSSDTRFDELSNLVIALLDEAEIWWSDNHF
jgi:hypothetical protein